jgi:hypothetical protein
MKCMKLSRSTRKKETIASVPTIDIQKMILGSHIKSLRINMNQSSSSKLSTNKREVYSKEQCIGIIRTIEGRRGNMI